MSFEIPDGAEVFAWMATSRDGNICNNLVEPSGTKSVAQTAKFYLEKYTNKQNKPPEITVHYEPLEGPYGIFFFVVVPAKVINYGNF